MKTIDKEKFCQILRRIWYSGKQKQPIGFIKRVGRYELETSLIESILTGWTGWRGIKNGSTFQNEDCDYFESQKAQMQTVETYRSWCDL